MGIQTRTIDRRLQEALRTVSYDRIDLTDVIPMDEDEILERCSRDREFAEKVEEVKLALSIAQHSSASVTEARNRLEQSVEDARRAAEQARNAHVQAHRALKEAEAEREAFENHGQVLDSGMVEKVLADARVVAKMDQTSSIEIQPDGNVYVTPRPYVMDYHGERYLLDNMKFTIRLSDFKIKWATPGVSHPHVSSENQIICWGHAEDPIAMHTENRDLAATVKTVLDWITFYNDESPYVDIERFSTTNQPEGWVLQ